LRLRNVKRVVPLPCHPGFREEVPKALPDSVALKRDHNRKLAADGRYYRPYDPPDTDGIGAVRDGIGCCVVIAGNAITKLKNPVQQIYMGSGEDGIGRIGHVEAADAPHQGMCLVLDIGRTLSHVHLADGCVRRITVSKAAVEWLHAKGLSVYRETSNCVVDAKRKRMWCAIVETPVGPPYFSLYMVGTCVKQRCRCVATQIEPEELEVTPNRRRFR
jgi:hypothetical protein